MRALLSVSDREGIVELARGLTDAGTELFATDGTRAHLTEAGIEGIRPVAELTETNEILGGRVKTLHPNIFAGLLARRDQPDHLAQLAEHGHRADRHRGRQPLPVRADGAAAEHDPGPGARADRHRRRGAPASGGQELPGRRRGQLARRSTHRSCATSRRTAASAPRPARSWPARRSPPPPPTTPRSRAT